MSEPTSHEPKPADSHATAAHGEHGHHDDFWGHCKPYFVIGGILIACTVLTVGLSYIDLGHTYRNFILGMILATFKVTLVGAVFMHLKGEKQAIWQPLYFTAFFVAGLFLITLFAMLGHIPGTSHFLP